MEIKSSSYNNIANRIEALKVIHTCYRCDWEKDFSQRETDDELLLAAYMWWIKNPEFSVIAFRQFVSYLTKPYVLATFPRCTWTDEFVPMLLALHKTHTAAICYFIAMFCYEIEFCLPEHLILRLRDYILSCTQ